MVTHLTCLFLISDFVALIGAFTAALSRHYTSGGERLYRPEKLQALADESAPGLWTVMEEAVGKKRRSQKRIVAMLHNYAYNRSQVS